MDDEVEGLTIALTPVQMAAVLGGEEVPESASLSNRLWGTLGLVGGVVELVGAGVLCLAPEPTMATKAGCVVLGVHGLDTLSSSSRQIWTGTTQRSATSLTVGAAAESLGASPHAAGMIGLAVDIAVPSVVALGFGALRVVSVMRGGRIVLAEHEAAAGSKLGGHTIREHVGKTDADLFARLKAKPSYTETSSFHNLDIAERAITAAMRANARAIKSWSRTAAIGSRPKRFDHDFGSVVGIGATSGSSAVRQLRGVRVVLNLRTYNGKPFYILTAYPI